jgi:hypothetical protein
VPDTAANHFVQKIEQYQHQDTRADNFSQAPKCRFANAFLALSKAANLGT